MLFGPRGTEIPSKQDQERAALASEFDELQGRANSYLMSALMGGHDAAGLSNMTKAQMAHLASQAWLAAKEFEAIARAEAERMGLLEQMQTQLDSVDTKVQ